MNPKELFPGQTKKDVIMRAVLSMPKGRPFSSQMVLDKMMKGQGMKCAVTDQTIVAFCLRYEGKYLRRIGEPPGLMWEVIDLDSMGYGFVPTSTEVDWE